MRSPQPKYSYSWDFALVTKHLDNLPDGIDLPIGVLTKKCAIPLALSGSKRQSDLSALDVRFKTCIPDGVTFQLASLTKSRGSKHYTEFSFPSFPRNKTLCPAVCLQSYLESSKAWRRDDNVPQPLFLSLQAPHKPVTPATIGRWLKDIMRWAGIDVGIFKSRSTRGAASSAATHEEVSIQEILLTADWTRFVLSLRNQSRIE